MTTKQGLEEAESALAKAKESGDTDKIKDAKAEVFSLRSRDRQKEVDRGLRADGIAVGGDAYEGTQN